MLYDKLIIDNAVYKYDDGNQSIVRIGAARRPLARSDNDRWLPSNYGEQEWEHNCTEDEQPLADDLPRGGDSGATVGDVD